MSIYIILLGTRNELGGKEIKISCENISPDLPLFYLWKVIMEPLI